MAALLLSERRSSLMWSSGGAGLPNSKLLLGLGKEFGLWFVEENSVFFDCLMADETVGFDGASLPGSGDLYEGPVPADSEERLSAFPADMMSPLGVNLAAFGSFSVGFGFKPAKPCFLANVRLSVFVAGLGSPSFGIL